MENTGVFRSILVGDDASEGANRAVEVAFALARCASAAVTLIGILTHPSAEVQAEGYGLEDHERAEQKIREGLKRTAQTGREMGLSIEERFVTGDAEQALADVANSGHFDLIVVGHRKVSRVRRWLERSISEDLLQDAQASILVVHQASEAGR